jgi:type II secretory pathway pseudopilin PulG
MPRRWSNEDGSTLLEALIALVILSVGLMGLAQVFALGVSQSSTAGAALVAREKAREAIESVHTARDTKLITWAQIRNVSQGGIFVDGPTPLRRPGPDNMVNTADDCATEGADPCDPAIESLRNPGPDGRINTDDDVFTPLTDFTRQITIEDVDGSPALRRVTITITYRVGRLQPPPYTLVTYVSAYS